MMKRKLVTAVCCVLCVCLLSSCQLARESAGTEVFEDRLVGVFITTEYLDLFDFEGYLNDHLGDRSGGEIVMGGDTVKYEGRLYAALTCKTLIDEETGEPAEQWEYVFEGVEGMPYFAATLLTDTDNAYTSTTTDEAISDAHIGITHSDDGKATTLEGTIFVTPTNQNWTYYLNPVYQTADGRVYLTAGSGYSASMESEGVWMSQSIASTITMQEKGKTITDSLTVTVSISVIFTPEKIVLLQMDAESMLLSRTEYNPANMPAVLVPETKTAYLIVEAYKQSGSGEKTIVRGIYGKDDASIEYFMAREDGIGIRHETRLEWK